MKKLLALLLVFIMVLSGCSLFKKEPHEAVNQGFQKHVGVEKMSSETSIRGTIANVPGEKPAKIDIGLTMTGVSDVSDEKAPRGDMKVQITVGLDDAKGSGELLVRTLDKKVFVNVVDIQVPGEAGTKIKEQLGSFLNKWWSLPLDDNSPLFTISPQQKEFREQVRTTEFFVGATEDALNEDVHGVTATRYRVEVNKDAVKKFIVEAIRASGNAVAPDSQTALEEALNDIEFSGAVWVGDSDDTLHRIRGTVSINPKQGATSSFDVDYTGWDYGKDVAVSAPEGAQEFNNLMLLPILSIFGSLVPPDHDTPPTEVSPTADEPLGADQVK